MITFRVKDVAEKQGLKNAHGLQLKAGLASHVAARIWKGQVERISVETIDRLCEALECEPGDFIVRVRERAEPKRKSKAKAER
jgi:DNA-binding Xre family transcriptional regulator